MFTNHFSSIDGLLYNTDKGVDGMGVYIHFNELEKCEQQQEFT